MATWHDADMNHYPQSFKISVFHRKRKLFVVHESQFDPSDRCQDTGVDPGTFGVDLGTYEFTPSQRHYSNNFNECPGRRLRSHNYRPIGAIQSTGGIEAYSSRSSTASLR